MRRATTEVTLFGESISHLTSFQKWEETLRYRWNPSNLSKHFAFVYLGRHGGFFILVTFSSVGLHLGRKQPKLVLYPYLPLRASDATIRQLSSPATVAVDAMVLMAEAPGPSARNALHVAQNISFYPII